MLASFSSQSNENMVSRLWPVQLTVGLYSVVNDLSCIESTEFPVFRTNCKQNTYFYTVCKLPSH